ncbi:MAG: hypothetical protein ACYDHN_03565 [Solirubrobacteraceae bacterium]
MTGRLTLLRDRPLSEQERQRLLLGAAAILTACTLVLASTAPARHIPRREWPATTAQRRTTSLAAGRIAEGVARVARRFVGGYLPYLYGHAPASRISGATPALIHSLQLHPPRVSPAMRATHPHLLTLRTATAASGKVAALALVNDGELADYSIEIILSPGSRGWRVSALGAG